MPGREHHRSRSSIFSKVPFKPLTTINDGFADRSVTPSTQDSGNTSKPKRHLSKSSAQLSSLSNEYHQNSANDAPSPLVTQLDSARQSTSDSNPPSPTPGSPAPGSRPSLTLSRKSIFGSLRGLRYSEDETPPGSAVSTSSRSSSFHWRDFGSKEDQKDYIDIGRNRTVLHHAEVVTNSSLFWKKREYLVLTETHLIRFKSQGKASEIFHSISPYPGRSGSIRHSPVLEHEDQGSTPSEGPGDKATAIPLNRVVATFPPLTSDEGKTLYALDIHYLEEEHASCLTIQLSDALTRDTWSNLIRCSADRARLLDISPIPIKLLEHAAQYVERERDYDRTRFWIYKVVKRAQVRPSNTAPNDEAQAANKTGDTACFLVIGLHKIHIINIPRGSAPQAGQSQMLSETREGVSFGILNVEWMLVRTDSDTFTVGCRKTFQKPVEFQLVCGAGADIARQLRQCYRNLTPLWQSRPATFLIPDDDDVDEEIQSIQTATDGDLACFDRTLMAFCACLDVNASDIRYTVIYDVEDAPRFELLPPDKRRGPGGDQYSGAELLAILRSLRFVEQFQSISFARISFEYLHRMVDYHDRDELYSGTSFHELMEWPTTWKPNTTVVITELRAIAMTNLRLRRVDFSSCIKTSSHFPQFSNELSCDFIEALAPLCRTQSTNVDWLTLNHINLINRDVDFLCDILSEKSSHLRGLELNGARIGEELVEKLLGTVAAQESTLEVLDIAKNKARLVPATIARQLAPLYLLRKLDLSVATMVPDGSPLLPLNVLSTWRLEELRLGHMVLDDVTVKNLCGYLAHSQSEVLRELYLRKCFLTGYHVSDLLRAMPQEEGTARPLHLDISENDLEKGHDAMLAAIRDNCAPTQITMRRITYDKEESLRKLWTALAQNRSIRKFDLAKLSAPGEASADTLRALENFFASNQALEELDLTGEPQSRLDPSRMFEALRQALPALKQNKKLARLSLNQQRLGAESLSLLSEVLHENTTLQRIICEHKEIKLHDFTDLVNAVVSNQTILYLGDFSSGRDLALQRAQAEILRDKTKSLSATDLKHPEPSTLRRTFTALTLSSPNSSPNSRDAKNLRSLTEQDARAALEILNKKWDEQISRLNTLLKRNLSLLTGQPASELDVQALLPSPDIETAERSSNEDRPGTADSISQIFRQVQEQTTPTAERPMALSAATSRSNFAASPSPHPSRSAAPAASPPISPHASPVPHGLKAKVSSLFSSSSTTATTTTPRPALRHVPSSALSSSSVLSDSMLASSPSLLAAVQIDTSPMLGSDGVLDMLTASGELPAVEREEGRVGDGTEVSRDVSRDVSGTGRRVQRENSIEEEEEGLIMARSPPRVGAQEAGLGIGGLS